MAAIRRALSPVPRAGTLLSGVASVASPLSKASSFAQNYPQSDGLLPSLVLGSSDSQAYVPDVFSPRSSRPFERSKPKGQVWRRPLFHFFVCFAVGFFIGLTPFLSMNLYTNLMPANQAFSFEVVSAAGHSQIYAGKTGHVMPLVDSSGLRNNATLEPPVVERKLTDGISDATPINKSFPQDSALGNRKLLIIVTPTYTRPFQTYYMNRLAHTLKLVPHPLLWIVVEMIPQSAETADILRRNGIMYRHLICNKNVTNVKDRSVQQRNVALSHIETHRLDGIVYFADDDNIYATDLFEQMRQIRRFGTWMVTKLIGDKSKAILEGPICNGTQVIGWHINESSGKSRRFHADMSGFAFNSTILWDPKRWHRPTLVPIRQLDTVNNGFQVSTFIEQVVEDESQMEGLLQDCSRILVWHLHLESSYSFYPNKWFMKNNLDVVAPLAQIS
ncbi:Glyco_transf_43 domain-containing protein [Cephalotus follicularis]|uniref:Glycosyltransferases n=1 Tax=Cephalotus follicularis TaxID=3775 RepID=A0A1Q3D8C7_CEPFO|nr:Glyco_transf_43 domain-containing protein [Cephalotus follicularis]